MMSFTWQVSGMYVWHCWKETVVPMRGKLCHENGSTEVETEKCIVLMTSWQRERGPECRWQRECPWPGVPNECQTVLSSQNLKSSDLTRWQEARFWFTHAGDRVIMSIGRRAELDRLPLCYVNVACLHQQCAKKDSLKATWRYAHADLTQLNEYCQSVKHEWSAGPVRSHTVWWRSVDISRWRRNYDNWGKLAATVGILWRTCQRMRVESMC